MRDTLLTLTQVLMALSEQDFLTLGTGVAYARLLVPEILALTQGLLLMCSLTNVFSHECVLLLMCPLTNVFSH